MSQDFKVTVTGERGEEFQQVFGTRTVHVLLPFPYLAQLEGQPEAQPIYMLDVDLLTPDQRARLVSHLARKFATSEVEIDRYLLHEGLPIRAADTVVTIDHPQTWLLDDDRPTEKMQSALFDEPWDIDADDADD